MSPMIRDRSTNKMGQVFGVNTIVALAGYNKHNRAMWVVRCSLCGKTKKVDTSGLSQKRGHGCSCQTPTRNTILHRKHGLSKSGLYMVWFNMMERCTNPSIKSYTHYGGRGISVCNEWADISSFHDWAIANGWKKGMEIDRIDNDGGYSPSNCRIVTRTINANNKSCNTRIFAFGENKTYGEWVADPRCSVKYTTLLMRITAYGYSPERAITEPTKKKSHVMD